MRYHRILLKLSGEALHGDEGSSINPDMLRYVANEVAAAKSLGTQIAIVVGGGNIVRGSDFADKIGVDRVTGDYMGMLATVINGMALHTALTEAGMEVRLQTALSIKQIAAPYIREKAVSYLEQGRVVIFAAGTGNPFFTTDTAAALRAAEIGAESLFKATNVNGVYSDNPKKVPSSSFYQQITVDEALTRNLSFMDATALALCRDRHLPVHVFKMTQPGALARILQGEEVGTLLTA